MMLLERQAQLEHLDALLAEAARGHGRVAALTGEAGAGKTTLVEAFIGAAARGTRLFRSACEDLSIPDTLGPLYDLAREARWALPQAIDVRQGQRLPLFSDALTSSRPRLSQPCLSSRTSIGRTTQLSISCGFSAAAFQTPTFSCC